MANECEMDSEAKAVLDKWLGGEANYELIHMWSGNSRIYYIVVMRNKVLLFLRVFLLGEEWVLSEDSGYPL